MYLRHNIDESMCSFFGLHYPMQKPLYKRMRYDVVLGIGGNIGDTKRRFEHLLVFLRRQRGVEVYKTGSILKNPPFGYEDQDDFFNSILYIKTTMTPHKFLSYVLRVEKRFGRKRSFANAPRTLDLDILFFDGRTMKTESLTLPHPHWDQRASVLIPLMGGRV